jgi:hypothetical protein
MGVCQFRQKSYFLPSGTVFRSLNARNMFSLLCVSGAPSKAWQNSQTERSLPHEMTVA